METVIFDQFWGPLGNMSTTLIHVVFAGLPHGIEVIQFYSGLFPPSKS